MYVAPRPPSLSGERRHGRHLRQSCRDAAPAGHRRDREPGGGRADLRVAHPRARPGDGSARVDRGARRGGGAAGPRSAERAPAPRRTRGLHPLVWRCAWPAPWRRRSSEVRSAERRPLPGRRAGSARRPRSRHDPSSSVAWPRRWLWPPRSSSSPSRWLWSPTGGSMSPGAARWHGWSCRSRSPWPRLPRRPSVGSIGRRGALVRRDVAWGDLLPMAFPLVALLSSVVLGSLALVALTPRVRLTGRRLGRAIRLGWRRVVMEGPPLAAIVVVVVLGGGVPAQLVDAGRRVV